MVDEAVIEAHSSYLLDSPSKERSKEKGEAPFGGNQPQVESSTFNWS